jgi:hypothetical protein
MPFKLPSGAASCEKLAPTLEDPVNTRSVLSFFEGREMLDARLVEVRLRFARDADLGNNSRR